MDVLQHLYEEKFYDFSHGFRKGRSQHKALHELREQCYQQNINWVLIADITGLFDNIDHQKLLGFIRRRVNDGAILRLIGKWLNAGVMEEDRLEYPDKGTPQGGVISPLLSNIFLHYVLDEWIANTDQVWKAAKEGQRSAEEWNFRLSRLHLLLGQQPQRVPRHQEKDSTQAT